MIIKRLRPMVIIISGLVILGAAGAIFLNQPKFGRVPHGDRKARMEQSPFYKDGKMENETPTEHITSDVGTFRTMLRFMTGKDKSDRLKPKAGEIEVVKSDLNNLPDSDCYVWFGHSSFLLKLNGKIILVDAVLLEGAPVSFANKPFKGTDYYKPEMMPDTIDYFVVSHDHWDHLDCATAKALRTRVKKVVCPLGIGEDFEYWGYDREQIIELDCNESQKTVDDLTFHCLPTRHFSGRGLRDAMRTQRASWLIETPVRTIFYTGDGGYSDRFERFGKAFPNIDLAIMENGQYNKDWSQIHTMPNELANEVKALNPKRFITVHHSKFALAKHAWDEPRETEKRVAEETGTPLIVAKIGEIVKL